MAELIATIDMREKTGTGRIVEKRLVLSIDGKKYRFFMTNDYEAICTDLESINCRPPLASDMRPDSTVAKKVSDKMKELGATWALTVCGIDTLYYYDKLTDSFFSVPFFEIPSDKETVKYPLCFVLVAADKGEELAELIKKGCDVNTKNENGESLLMHAVFFNACSSIRVLIKLGADVNATNKEGSTALGIAALMNRLEAARILASVPGINLEVKDNIGGAALRSAVFYDSIDMCLLLANAGADLNARDLYGNTPLLWAANNKSEKAAEFLIRSGVDLNAENHKGLTPLIVASGHGNTAIVSMLLDAGADVRHKDKEDYTAFLRAVKNNATDVISLFIEKKQVSKEQLETALVQGAVRGIAESTDLLIRMSDDSGKAAFNALLGACMKDRADIARICMKYPCNVNDTSNGFTPLMMVCFFRSVKVAEIILDNGADANVATVKRFTPLMMSSFYGASKITKLLLSHGADVNAADDEGMTALMYAAMRENADIIYILLSNGADKTMKSMEGKTFEDYAGEFDQKNFEKMLKERENARSSGKDAAAPAGHKSFGETFDFYMKKYFERFPDKKNPDIYKAAGLDKRRFSKMLSSRNDPDYRPRKETVTALALGLRLSLAESEDLLQSAGCILSPRDKADMKIQSFFAAGNYNIFDLNNSIYESTGRLFFKSMTEEED